MMLTCSKQTVNSSNVTAYLYLFVVELQQLYSPPVV
jgi:hypothetical protein